MFKPMNPPITQWQGKNVWLIGASTGIGQALALALVAKGARVFVSARSQDKLSQLASQHPNLHALPLDVTNLEAFKACADQLTVQLGSVPERNAKLDLACYCAGTYQAQQATQYDLAQMLEHNAINYVGALHGLEVLLPPFLAQQSGHISLISSVAGYHGLPKSLAYGPTKAALINLAHGLYLDLHPKGLGVSLINPGFVRTPLTAQNTFTMPALLTPEEAAKRIIKGWERGHFEIHFPKRFTLWLKLLCLLPNRVALWALRKL